MKSDDKLKEFVIYITNKWGILASITTLFPIANILFGIIPLPIDPYGKSTAPIAYPLTILVCIFLIYDTFINGTKKITENKAKNLFFLGFISLMIFLLLSHFEYPLRLWLFPSLDSTDDYTLMLIGIVPFYILFFASVTRAFTILAMIQKSRENQN